VGEGLVVSGWSVEDELIEAIELPGKRFALGVIWHPEEDRDSRLIASLVDAAGGAFVRQGDAKATRAQEDAA
jgi:putative glutamine amidotransferase